MFASPIEWPRVAFNAVPPLATAEQIAAVVRGAVGTMPDTPQDVSRLLTMGGFELRTGSLSAHGGGIEATLAPRPDNQFALFVDTEPRNGWSAIGAGLRKDVARHRLRFRMAHEVGHSFFYDRSGQRPRRLAFDSPEQERWCDRFASALLLPPGVVATTRVTPHALLDLHRRFDVSLQASARAFARVHRERFVALLVTRGPRPPYLRVQWQKRYGAPVPRWWAANELQYALAHDRRSGILELPWPRGTRAARWRTLPDRGQLLVVA